MQPSYAMPFVILQLFSELCKYLDNNKDTLDKEIVNDELNVDYIDISLSFLLHS